MKKFIILTTSESGDSYHYFIECKKFSSSKFMLWLSINSNDKSEDGYTYESITDVIELDAALFQTI